MPVTTIPVSSRLQLRLNTGLDENFEPVLGSIVCGNIFNISGGDIAGKVSPRL